VVTEYIKMSLKEVSLWFHVLMIFPEAGKVREWCECHKLHDDYLLQVLSDSETLNPASPLEEALFRLALKFCLFNELTEWERAWGEDRYDHSQRIAKLVREAAELLESKPALECPPALALFDEERALDILRAFPPDRVERMFESRRFEEKEGVIRYCFDRTKSGQLSAADALAFHFSWPKAQEMPSMLRRLAEYVEEQANSPRREARPNTPTPMRADARAFARYLTAYFEKTYKLTPDEVIATCVALRFPELDPAPGTEDVRAWRGAR
jgi:hypothetical protein